MKKLFLTPQGIAKTISRIEDELDVSLFIRTKKGITPTEYADALYEKANIGFMMGPIDDYKFKSFYITTNKYVILLPEEHPLARKSSITLEDLAGISLAIKGKEYDIYPIHLNKFIKKNIYPNIELETSDDAFLFEYAANRLGGAVILEYQAKLKRFAIYMQKYHLTTRHLSDAVFSREVYFVEPVNAHLTPAETAFKEYIYSNRESL